MNEIITPFDLQRMFIGAEPYLFYAEMVVRVIIIYTYTLLLVRWIGGRSVAQLSMVEFLLVIALGSAVGDPLFYPDVPLFHAMTAITLVMFFNKGLDMLILHFEAAGRIIDGEPVEIASNGRIRVKGARARKLGLDEIKSQLRIHGIRNLGEIDKAYIESGGVFSVFRRGEPVPGLPIVPPKEIEAPPLISHGKGLCCAGCGSIADVEAGTGTCKHCGQGEWTRPVLFENQPANM